MKGSFAIVKGQVWACLCRSVGLAGLKTLGLVMTGPFGFHSKGYWLSGFVYYPFMGGSPLLCWAFLPWVGAPVLLGIDPLGHMAQGLLTTLMFMLCRR